MSRSNAHKLRHYAAYFPLTGKTDLLYPKTVASLVYVFYGIRYLSQMPLNKSLKNSNHKFIDRALKSACFLVSVLFYGNSRNGDWIYEKMNRPRSYVHEFMNILYYLIKKPAIHNVISLIVEPVFGCNLRCTYCWHSIIHYFEHKEKRPHLMTMDLFKKIVDDAPASVESIAFALIGEPLLHPEIHTMIRYARSKGLRTVLYTNGTLLSEKNMVRIAESGLDVLTVSVEPDEINSLKHRGVSLERIREKVESFVRIKPDSMEVKLSVVVHKDNAHTVPFMDNQYKNLIRSIKLSPMIRYNGNRLRGNCIEPWRGSLSILTNGDVSPCCVSAGYRSIPVGNITKDSLVDIIHGPVFKNLLRDFMIGKRPEVCHRCRSFQGKHIPLRVPSLRK